NPRPGRRDPGSADRHAAAAPYSQPDPARRHRGSRGPARAGPLDLRRAPSVQRAGQGAGIRRGLLQGVLPDSSGVVHHRRAHRSGGEDHCTNHSLTRGGGVRQSQLPRGQSTIAVRGLAKNTGTTVSLHQLIRELDESTRRTGATSVGRDGERTDVLDSAIVKPPIHLPLGTLFTSTPQLLQRADVRYRILHRTQIRTPLGTLVVGLVTAPGQLEVTGPPSFAPLHQIRDLMHRLGADLVLIDGAFDRKAAASPEISDGVILSTGAVLSPDPDDVVQITRSRVEMLRLPTVTDPLVRE